MCYGADWISEPAIKKSSVDQHSADKQPQQANLVQPLSLPSSQSPRKFFQQDQAVPSARNALRQVRRYLAFNGVNQALAPR
jgi:hypothetical protein